MVNSYGFVDELSADRYAELLDTVALFANFVCFVITDGISHYGPRTPQVIDALAGCLVEIEYDVGAWPGTLLLPGGGSHRYVFQLTAEALRVLERSASSVFDWHHRALPDDLHFLRSDRTVVFASIGHEQDAWLELTSEELEQWQALGRFDLILEQHR